MFKWLSFLMIIPILFCSQANAVVDLFSQASTIEIYSDGQILEMSEQEQEQFDQLFCLAIEDAKQMPAIGVSLHDETVKEMQHGLWIKFVFDETIVKSEMPFDELLLQVQKDCHGLNVIRGNGGRYEGRCFYLDLKYTFNDVYDFLLTLDGDNEKIEIELESQEIEETSIVTEKDSEQDDEEDGESDGHKNIVIKQEPIPNEQGETTKSQQELLNHLK